MEPEIKPFILILDGPMGSGKTTASKILNEKLEGTARVALADVKRFISGFEKDHAYNKISQEVIIVMTEEYIKRGISVIVEWAMRKERAETLKAIADKYNARFFMYQLDAPKELLIQRVKDRTKLMLNKPELSEKNLENIHENFETNYAFHVEHRHTGANVLNSEKLSSEQIVEKIIKEIEK